MSDFEKVIKALECCIFSDEECECLDECPYHDDCWETNLESGYILKKDALELLKKQEARELTKEEWEAWKKSPKRDPICMVYHQDTTPIWVLDPTAVNEVLYYMGKIKLFTNKPERKQVKWNE